MNRASLALRVDAGHENLRSHVAGSSPPNLLRAHSMAGKRAVRPVIDVPMLIAPGREPRRWEILRPAGLPCLVVAATPPTPQRTRPAPPGALTGRPARTT